MPTPTPVDMDAELAALQTIVAQDDAAPAVVVRERGGEKEKSAETENPPPSPSPSPSPSTLSRTLGPLLTRPPPPHPSPRSHPRRPR